MGDALTPLVRAFDRDDVAIAGGALFFEDGVTQAAGLVVLPNAHWHYFCRNLPATLADVERSRDALGVSGAAMAVRTPWFLESGGFDESFVNGFEDVDLCLRAREQEREIVYAADARFAHYEGASAGRFAREAENERHFYRRWSSRLGSLPRTARGDVGAIALYGGSDASPLLRAGLSDLEDALGSFGHPLARHAIAPWRRFDRRFRHSAALTWFMDEGSAPGIAIEGDGSRPASIRSLGAVSLEVPWLPCASAERIAALGVRRSEDAACTTVGVAGGDGYSGVRITPQMLLGGGDLPLACVVHLGLTDESAFGNVLLAQAGIPSIVLASPALRGLFAPDVALVTEFDAIAGAVAEMVGDSAKRARYGALVAADAKRRFSPRRSAIRVVDMLCAARFGLERPGRAHGNSP